MKLSIGVDHVDVERLERLIEDGGADFLEVGWTTQEIEECAGHVARLATRWAAKEAAMKALRAGIGVIDPTDIEVEVDRDGAPSLILGGSAQKRARELQLENWSVSLSHEAGIAIAFVVASHGEKHG